jgi:hypothetical protein
LGLFSVCRDEGRARVSHYGDGRCTELKKLTSYVNADVFIEEIVWRMLDIGAKLKTVLGHSWSVLYGANKEDMEELEREAYVDYIREPGMDDAEWAAENDVDWEEVEDRRMN